MDKSPSPSTRGPVSPVKTMASPPNAATPRLTSQLKNLELETMARKRKSPPRKTKSPPRITKSPSPPGKTKSPFRKTKSPPRDRQLKELALGDDGDLPETDDLYEAMQKEKDRYPGANGWAPDEERLFEILFMRQHLPVLPSNWSIDFSTVPMTDNMFQTSEEQPPIIHAHGKDFKATKALLDLIDLTTGVTMNIQTELVHRVPRLIKRQIDRYINWAAQDGEYNHLRIVPNIMVEVINSRLGKEAIMDHIENRMRDLARLQREFLRDDRAEDFWDVVKPSLMKSPWIKLEPQDTLATPISMIKAVPKRKELVKENEKSTEPDKPAAATAGFDGVQIKVEPGTKRKRPLLSPTSSDDDEPAEEKDKKEESRPMKRRRTSKSPSPEPNTPSLKIDTQRPLSKILETFNSWRSMLSASTATPTTPVKQTYRRHPPVVYGIFILHSSALLMTVDSSKGDNAYVSYHVQSVFNDTQLSVWNALTIAIAVCRARDELRGRREDFEALPVEVESDPDA